MGFVDVSREICRADQLRYSADAHHSNVSHAGKLLGDFPLTLLSDLKGRGKKNIVLLGNSHARTEFYGIEYNFHYLYDHLTLLANHQCVLIRLKDKINYMTKVNFCCKH